MKVKVNFGFLYAVYVLKTSLLKLMLLLISLKISLQVVSTVADMSDKVNISSEDPAFAAVGDSVFEATPPSGKDISNIVNSMHRGSALSPLLFVIVMKAISWELLYADELVVIAETEEDLIKRLNECYF